MKITESIKRLNDAVAEFDMITAGEFDRETDPKTLVLFAGAFSPRGTDLPYRLAKALKDTGYTK